MRRKMNSFRTWLVCESRYASVIEKISISDELTLFTSDDPSFRHWCSPDGHAVTVIEQECSSEEERMQAQNSVRAKRHGCQAYTVDTYALLAKCPNHAFHPING